MMEFPDEYEAFFMEENDIEDDEAALEYLRELEEPNARPNAGVVKSPAPRSPANKRPRLEASAATTLVKKNILEDLTNIMVDAATDDDDDEEPIETTQTYRIPQLGQRKIYRRVPLDGDYQTLTMNDGERFYIKMKQNLIQDDDDSSKVEKSTYTGLCGQPYSVLLERAIQEQLRIQESIKSHTETYHDSVVTESDSGIESSEDESSRTTLWVEKFRPKSYMQLLSDDGTNRTLLHWLKLWDKIVYGKELPKKPAKPGQEASDDAKNPPQFHNKNEVIDELDSTGRPHQKSALLYGPPGLGKTTLAHIVARHAGYNVVEINASDDRSLQAFKIKLDAATQMKSVNNADQRPNCLIIDEIDGSPAATVNYLVKYLEGKHLENNNKKKKSNNDLLSRPIICICNDLYVPSLRPLRQASLLLQFPPTSSQRLAQRLSHISLREQLKTDMTALMALCEKSQNDIRSCLSTLQFFKSRGLKLTSYDVHKTFVGSKDETKSHFSVWQELFQMPRPTKRKYVNLAKDNQVEQEENSAAMEVRFRHILRTIMANGDYEKLQQGIFENYLEIKFKDSRFQNVLRGQDWFCFYDVVQQQIMHSQNYSMMAYQPYNFVASHFYFAAFGKVKIKYPSSFSEMKMAGQKSLQVFENLCSAMSPQAKCYSNTTALCREILPCLLEIMRPNLRPVNTQLYTKSEKETLKNLIGCMLEYNLNYVQEKEDSGYVYKLDPNIEAVAQFPNIFHQKLPYAIKQLVAHELMKEKMRRSEPVTPMNIAESAKPKNAVENVPSHLRQKLTAKQVEVKDHVPVDFFGRKIQVKIPTADENKEAKKNEIIISDVWFKFKEGYNNAVRRTIRMKDMI